MKYEDWIKYEEARLAEKKDYLSSDFLAHSNGANTNGSGASLVASYRERCLVEVLLQQQALIDALQAQLSSMQPHSTVSPL